MAAPSTDLPGVRLEQNPGLRKVFNFCRAAQADGHEWAWVDTVCTDKTSDAELAEAINSMFQLYKSA